MSDLLEFSLRRAGLDTAISEVEAALGVVVTTRPHLLLLDLANASLGVLERVRRYSPAPVILPARTHSEEDVERGLELGADDYMTHPFSFRELLARVHALRRRADVGATLSNAPHEQLQAGTLASI